MLRPVAGRVDDVQVDVTETHDFSLLERVVCVGDAGIFVHVNLGAGCLSQPPVTGDMIGVIVRLYDVANTEAVLLGQVEIGLDLPTWIDPLYRRIHDDLKAKIEAGEYRPGDRLPSELELARSYGVSRITSRQALDLLCSEGLLIRRQGIGSFVRTSRVTQPLVRLTDFVEDMAQAGLKAESRVLRFESEPATSALASLLGIEPNATVFRLDRLRMADGKPIALDWTWLPAQFGKLLAGEDLAERTIYGILEKEYGVPIVSGEYTIEACIAGEDQGKLLEIVAGDPLLLFGRTSFSEGGRAVYHQKRFYRADLVQYRLTLARTAPGAARLSHLSRCSLVATADIEPGAHWTAARS